VRTTERIPNHRDLQFRGAFPRCKLWNTNLVRRLPDGCPLRSRAPLAEVHAYEERGFELIALGRSSTRAFAIADTCGRCVPQALSLPSIKALRVLASQEEV